MTTRSTNSLLLLGLALMLTFVWLLTRAAGGSEPRTSDAATPSSAVLPEATSLEPTPHLAADRSTATPDREPPGASPQNATVDAVEDPEEVAPFQVRARLCDREGHGLPGLVVQIKGQSQLGLATTDANGVLEAFPCADDDPCELEVRLAAVPLAHYGEEIRVLVRPTRPEDPRPDVVLQHGPRVIIDAILPGGTTATDFVVEFLHEHSLLSSQMGRLGGCAALYEGPRGPWAWSPPITNSVRGEGGSARILSRDGLWASPRVRVTDENRRPIERRIENHDEVYVRTSLIPAGVVHLRVAPPHDRAQLMLMPEIESGFANRIDPHAEDMLLQIPTPGAIDSNGVHRFHWLAPGPWRVGAAFGNQTATPAVVTARAGQIVEVDVTMRDP